ncbi:MAG: glutamate 5-kinase [Victivallaceae bacterium]|nr:glutamate 5-kinase [Victivallaceae bacterium]
MNTERKQIINNCKRVVIKVGTRLLTDEHRIPVLISGISKFREKGHRVILVSSGAVGIGMKELGLKKRPSKLAEIQALAAIGQNKLMSIYDDQCRKHNFKSAQLLLTTADLHSRERHLNVLNCINSLLENDILPIVNENDSVSVDELKFGDNDGLAALLATMTHAELTVVLTTESGLREKDNGVLGERISLVKQISAKMRKAAEGTDNTEFSIGGMASKLNAAKIVNSAGEYLWIADGREDDTIDKILSGEDVGTLFVPNANKMQARERWLHFFAKSTGHLIVDDGAANAVCSSGSSLLPAGVKGVDGKFKRGDTVEIIDSKANIIARGLSNFDSADAAAIAGKQSNEIFQILQRDSDDVIVHRNNLTLVRSEAL